MVLYEARNDMGTYSDWNGTVYLSGSLVTRHAAHFGASDFVK